MLMLVTFPGLLTIGANFELDEEVGPVDGGFEVGAGGTGPNFGGVGGRRSEPERKIKFILKTRMGTS